MHLCILVVNTIRIIVRTVIQIVREILTTVCSWVTTVIKIIREVMEKVCSWLPWPLNKVCNWVTKTIEIIETVTEWVCEEVVQRIVEWVEIVFEYISYILTWVCWLVSWPLRFLLDHLWCWLGISPRKFMHIWAKILTDERDTPAMSVEAVRALLGETQKRLDRCNITLCVLGIELVKKPAFLTGVRCGIRGLFSSHHAWFTKNQFTGGVGSSIVPITLYVISNVDPGKGCSIPGTHYIIIDTEASNATIAHEIGHLSDLWRHSDNPQNVMYSPSSDDSINFTKSQCCMIRSSRYSTLSSFFGCSSKGLRTKVLVGKSSSCCGQR